MMNRTIMMLSAGLMVCAPLALSAHCQVPCGIYGDVEKHEELSQHAETVKKASLQIAELSAKKDPQSQQQLVRWVLNKESHAQKIQDEMASYFLAQRIKKDQPTAEGYQAQLTAAHAVIVAAMKCKQSSDPEKSTELTSALAAFKATLK